LEITVIFNEAMDTASVIPVLVPSGLRAFDLGDNQNVTSAWSSDNKTLTITSSGPLLANKTYALDVDTGGSAQDVDGNVLDTTGGAATGGGGITSAVYNLLPAGISYRSASGGVPNAPTDLNLNVIGTTEVDFAQANTGAGNIQLTWLAPATGEVSTYNVYVAKDDAGPWTFVNNTGVNSIGFTVTTLNTTLYGGMFNAGCIKTLAFITEPVHFKVVAANGEGEGAAVTMMKRDSIGPKPAGLVRNPAGVNSPITAAEGGSLTNYNAGAEANGGYYAWWNEPMDLDTVENAALYKAHTNTAAGGLTASSAQVVYNSGGVTLVEVNFGGSLFSAVTPGTIEAGPVDLSGNSMEWGGSPLVIQP
jgi:hypothetical protein